MGIALLELADLLRFRPGVRGTDCARFSRSEVARLLRIAEVLDQAQRLFGDRNRSLQWIKHENRALGFKTPLAQLETSAGTKRVLALLRRIECGGFA
jgi:putative toxin-antitoxin system antitoxin component (TIGR02293 family)